MSFCVSCYRYFRRVYGHFLAQHVTEIDLENVTVVPEESVVVVAIFYPQQETGDCPASRSVYLPQFLFFVKFFLVFPKFLNGEALLYVFYNAFPFKI
ncbi:hypothetical protein MHBO_004960 [Bonamia ostreae]|uniref:Uncharacterized protein n=1 Tax=Bonamia ostreae TaxID=126728 RepID=A0ABV2AUT7_9EUKA